MKPYFKKYLAFFLAVVMLQAPVTIRGSELEAASLPTEVAADAGEALATFPEAVELTVQEEATTTEEPTVTPEPTVTEEPTVTPEPTITEEPTTTPEPGVTEGPTVTPEPAVTEEPTVTPEPTVTSEPSSTPEPTAIPDPTATPTSTPTPTNTPTPTSTPAPVNISKASVAAIKNVTYTGSAFKPSPAVSYKGKKLVKGTDYTLKYSANNKVGTATVTITGRGKFTGTKKVTFKILPVSTKLSALANTTKGVKITWKKSSAATGYILYRNDEKIKTISSNATLSYTDTKAKTNGTKYVYRIATYKTVNGAKYVGTKSGAKTIYFVARPTVKKLSNTAKGITIQWSKNSKASGYYIYRGSDKIKTVKSASTVKYTDTGANVNGKKYTYKVVAYKTVSGKTYKSPASKAAVHYFVSKNAVKKLSSTSKGVSVQWTQNSKASGYYIYRNGSKVKTVSGSSTASWTDTGAARNGEQYFYKVVSFKKANDVIYKAAASAEKSITYKKPVVATPTPTPRPTVTPTPKPVAPVSGTVYITKTGEKYHRDGCGSLSRSKIPISRADAIARGYTPCHNCNPG